ncbi:hypothetical protein [Bdellovibrio sp. ArHS]|uniref:hypothetical protein n=1 Tax=Bdellovibrio sp. ArHS TaxID=1569284 RepID=UPI000AB632C0|nr:hypothetical protein [Bdellovibrio sp. ArHS]
MEIVFTALVAIFFGFIFHGVGKDDQKTEIIENKGFCVERKITGVDFKKCYKIEEVGK